MNEIELIQSLFVQINELPYRDRDTLDALRRRARMITKKVFGAEVDPIVWTTIGPN